jgi:hypothetical protein
MCGRWTKFSNLVNSSPFELSSKFLPETVLFATEWRKKETQNRFSYSLLHETKNAQAINTQKRANLLQLINPFYELVIGKST